jgi:hypothetical protein
MALQFTDGRAQLMSGLETRFEAFIFEWGLCAAGDARADLTAVRERSEALCASGAHVFVTGGADIASVDEQLRARPGGPGHDLASGQRTQRVKGPY